MAAKKKLTRRQFTDDFKRKVVRDTNKPGASVKGVADKYDIVAGVVSRWRQEPQYQATTSSLPTRPRTNGAARPEPQRQISRLDALENRVKELEAQIFAAPPAL